MNRKSTFKLNITLRHAATNRSLRLVIYLLIMTSQFCYFLQSWFACLLSPTLGSL